MRETEQGVRRVRKRERMRQTDRHDTVRDKRLELNTFAHKWHKDYGEARLALTMPRYKSYRDVVRRATHTQKEPQMQRGRIEEGLKVWITDTVSISFALCQEMNRVATGTRQGDLVVWDVEETKGEKVGFKIKTGSAEGTSLLIHAVGAASL